MVHGEIVHGPSLFHLFPQNNWLPQIFSGAQLSCRACTSVISVTKKRAGSSSALILSIIQMRRQSLPILIDQTDAA